MSFKDLKITTYQDSVSALPDYPSDAGITAAQLKAVFDGRTDKEIKTKFNALIDEIVEKFGLVEVDIADAVENHNQYEDAHEGLFAEIREMIVNAVSDKVTEEELEPIISGLDLIISGKADSTELEKKVDKTVFNAHVADVDNPHNVTADQVGTYTTIEIDTLIAGAGGNVDLSRYYTKNEIDSFRIEDEMYMERHVGLRINESLGDIASALDELHEYAISLAGGEG